MDKDMIFEPYSSGYYRASMHVEPYENGPVVSCELYNFIDGEKYAKTDAPPLFRLGLNGEPYFEVDCEFSIPDDTLGIPEEWFDDMGAEHTYGERDVFVCKPSHAYALGQSVLSGTTTNVVDVDTIIDENFDSGDDT